MASKTKQLNKTSKSVDIMGFAPGDVEAQSRAEFEAIWEEAKEAFKNAKTDKQKAETRRARDRAYAVFYRERIAAVAAARKERRAAEAEAAKAAVDKAPKKVAKTAKK